MSVVEIPLSSQAQVFTITLAGVVYNFRVTFNAADEGGWTLDIGDQAGVMILAGLPLVTGVDILAQHAHLGFGGALFVSTDRGAGEAPTYEGLGLTSHLYFRSAA